MDDKPPSNFLDRLKRHYIFRIAAVYAIAAWVVIQLFNNVLPNLGLSKDSVRFVIIIVTLGFPVVLILAWTFIDPKGDGHTEPSGWIRMRLRIGSALSLIIIVLVSISGWYLWKAAVVAHVAQLVSEAAPKNTAPVFNPSSRSIAVLPFRDQSTNPNEQYFSDGITQEITGALGSLPGVRVISWQSTSVYRGKNISVTEVGRALNVANVLVGSISRDGDRVRISTELVSAITGFQLWSAHYDRTFKDVFAIQDSISKAMVDALQLHLSGNGPLVTAATTNTTAHDYYLKGLEATSTRTAESLEAAIKYYQQAVRLDPHYAQAYAALAWTYALSHQYTNTPLEQSLPLAKQAAKQALRINKNLSSAHMAMGVVYLLEEKISRGQAELRRAMELNPNNLDAYVVYASTLTPNNFKEALVYLQQAAVINPNSAIAHYDLGYVYESLGDYKNAINEMQAAIGLAPQHVFTRIDLAGIYYRNSDLKSAVGILSNIKIDDPLQAQILNAARLTYMAQQNPDLNNQAIAALKGIETNKLSTVYKETLIALYALMGQRDHAIDLLKDACANAPETCGDLAINPSYKKLRNEPEFKALLKKYSLNN
ncbi:MAG: tetratricopeptide repeat protein [Gammaproteobacteria bacterium]